MKNIQHLRRKLVACGRKMYGAGFVIGTGGNISARSGDTMYVKASGVSLQTARLDDYIAVDLKTKQRTCSSPACSIEVPMHIACYEARPDIGAVIHTHPLFGTAAGMLNVKIGYVSYEFMFALGSEVPTVRYFRAGSIGLARAVKKAITRHNGLLLKNHGVLVVGKDLEEASLRALALERACAVTLYTKLAGKVSTLPPSELKRIYNARGGG